MLSYFDSRDINRGPIKKSVFFNAIKESSSFNHRVYAKVKRLIKVRKQTPVLSHGTFVELKTQSPEVFAYVREFEGERIVVINNLSNSRVRATVNFINDNFGKKSKDVYFKDLLSDKMIRAKAENKQIVVRLKPYDSLWLKL